jgi:hypothetical protein
MAVALLAACGGDDDDGGGDDDGGSTAENALAEDLLLTLDDFADDWTEMPDEDEDTPNPLDECDPGTPEGRTGEAESGEFSDGSVTFQQSVGVFESADDAVAALERVPGMGDCMVGIVNDGGLDDDEATYSDARFEEVDAPNIGDASSAYTLEMEVTVPGESDEEEQSGTIYFDLVFLTEGRFATNVQSVSVLFPTDESLLQEVTEAAHAKLAAAEQ